MINVVLDTSIYKSEPSRKGPHFKAVENLALSKIIKLHVPYVVEREFQTQQRQVYDEALKKITSNLSSLTKKNISAQNFKILSKCQKEVKKISEELLDTSESEVVDWFKKLDAIRFPLCLEQANEALEAYFQGKPPLKNIKEREDIPDSFIARAIEKIQATCEELHVIVNDKALRKTFSSSPSITVYKNLAEFIESDLIQDAMLEADLFENYEDLIVAIEAIETETQIIQQCIANSVGEELVWKTIYGDSIPDDNHEATINMYGEAEGIELNFDEAFYFGNGQFGIPFNLNIEVQAYYYIFKGDYFTLQNAPSVTDHNDHYFEAEDDFEVRVEGIAALSLDKKKINTKEFAECVDMESVRISEITNIELCE